MNPKPVMAPETMGIAPAADGNLLVTLTHAWSDDEIVSFTVKVPKADIKISQLRELACQEVARRLAGTSPGS